MTVSQYPIIAEAIAEAAGLWTRPGLAERARAIEATLECRNTFTPEALEAAVGTIMSRIRRGALDSWLAGRQTVRSRSIAVLNAGNVPFVGLQDLLAVICTGHRYVGVVSSKSPHLLPAFVSTMCRIFSRLPVLFTDFDEALRRSEALIATGTDDTVHQIASAARRAGLDPFLTLLRGTRISVAVVDGHEETKHLDALAVDILLNEGRGCLNASIIFAPAGLDWDPLIAAMVRFRRRFPPHQSTVDTIQAEARLYRAIGQRHQECPGIMLVDSTPNPKRAGIVVWSSFSTFEEVERWIQSNSERLQVVIKSERIGIKLGNITSCLPGQSQDPPLDWSPDRKDTIRFLVEI